MTTTTTTSPAFRLARLCAALAMHLTAHEHLPIVHTRPGNDMQVTCSDTTGRVTQAEGAAAVLLWAKTLNAPRVELMYIEEHGICVTVHGFLGDLAVSVWDTDDGDISRLVDRTLKSYEYTPITLDQLAAYVANGTVEVPS